MNLKYIIVTVFTIALSSIGLSAIANPKPSVFCSSDAETLLGDVCVDSQGRVPDNADIRSVFLASCTPGRQGVVSANDNGTVQGRFNAFWDEYWFCSRHILSNGHSIYYMRINFENNIIYRYSTQNESWGRLEIFSYSVQSGVLNGRLITLTENGRELSEPEIERLNVSSMYASLADLLALRNISPRVARELNP
jgi:hypothetical protein